MHYKKCDLWGVNSPCVTLSHKIITWCSIIYCLSWWWYFRLSGYKSLSTFFVLSCIDTVKNAPSVITIFYLKLIWTSFLYFQAKYRFVGKKNPKPEKPKKPSVVVKQIGGEKNGGTRTVLLRRRKSFYPTQDK